jgi:chromosome segregation ATPase
LGGFVTYGWGCSAGCRLQTDHASFFKLAQRQQTLEDEVKKLQGDLANYNLMVDKSHTVTDPEEVEREYRALKAVNEKETKKIDVIITERSEIERRARDIDTSIKKHQDAVQQKMDELPEEKRDQWFALQEEDRQLTTEISGLQSQVEEVRNQVLNEEDALLRDPLKKQALDLTRAVAEKEQEAEELKKATAHLRLSFPEQKKLLLDQVKRDNEDMRKIEDEMKLLKEEVNAGRDRLHEMDTDLA